MISYGSRYDATLAAIKSYDKILEELSGGEAFCKSIERPDVEYYIIKAVLLNEDLKFVRHLSFLEKVGAAREQLQTEKNAHVPSTMKRVQDLSKQKLADEYNIQLLQRLRDDLNDKNSEEISALKDELNLWKSRAYFAVDQGFFEVGGPGDWVVYKTGEFYEGNKNYFKNQDWYIPVSDEN